MPRKGATPKLSAEQFLRSINLRFDAAFPERIEHFRPTSKSAELIHSLAAVSGGRSMMVIAPYGTGKSITATYALQLIENRPEARGVLKSIARHLDGVDPALSTFAKKRATSRNHGITLALHGHAPNLAAAVKDAAVEAMERLRLGRQARTVKAHDAATAADAVAILQLLAGKANQEGLDRIAIVWDEFGRHLETIVADGRAAGLLDVQLLAEFVSRASAPPMSMAVLLHRGLLHYAANMPQSVLGEWKKVEGRFVPIQYVDESKELLRLVADVVQTSRRIKAPQPAEIRRTSRETRSAGLFSEQKASELENLLTTAYPLRPATLHLLPRLAARVAQNERTLFGFLNAQPLNRPVTPADLYDYFSPAMQSDLGTGGTYKRWVETESALSKAADIPDAPLVLKTACLLSLGASGERPAASRSLLLAAIRTDLEPDRAENAIAALLMRGLLFHRKHSDEVAIWHGTDLDLRGRLAEEKRRRRPLFSLTPFLTQEVPLPVWRPVRYNADSGVRRFFEGEYHTLESLEKHLRLPPSEGPRYRGDGQILNVLIEGEAELARATELLRAATVDRPQEIVALPNGAAPVFDSALELDALLSMGLDKSLIELDPLARDELNQMTDDARAHLERLLQAATHPSPLGPSWFYRGESHSLESPRALRELLSGICEDVFPDTPKIFNEMIVRSRPSPVVINARKKLLLGILERAGEENLGLVGNFPDSSMFRSVLLNPKLYRPTDDGWVFAEPEALTDDRGLAKVWDRFKDFFTTPSDGPKDLEGFLQELQAPPYGVRAGLLPIFFAAGMKAFASGIALSRDGEYLTDILPSTIEALCREPGAYSMRVLHLDAAAREYLEGFLRLFGVAWQGTGTRQELVRVCFDTLQAWKASLPPGAWKTRALSGEGRLFRDVMGRPADPVSMLFRHLPRVCGVSATEPRALLARIEAHKKEMESVSAVYAEQAKQVILSAMDLGDPESSGDLPEIARRWSLCFPADLGDALDGISRAILAQTSVGSASERKFINSLATLVTGQPLNRWDDSSLTTFQREIKAATQRIEERAIAHATREGGMDAASGEGLAHLATSRLARLYQQLVTIVGHEAARHRTLEVLRGVEGASVSEPEEEVG